MDSYFKEKVFFTIDIAYFICEFYLAKISIFAKCLSLPLYVIEIHTFLVLGKYMVSLSNFDYNCNFLSTQLRAFKIKFNSFSRMRMIISVFGLQIKQGRYISALRINCPRIDPRGIVRKPNPIVIGLSYTQFKFLSLYLDLNLHLI